MAIIYQNQNLCIFAACILCEPNKTTFLHLLRMFYIVFAMQVFSLDFFALQDTHTHAHYKTYTHTRAYVYVLYKKETSLYLLVTS